MTDHEVNVTRDGRWWMIEIPALDGLTQARRLSEVEDMACSYIAVALDVPLSAVTIGALRIRVNEGPDLTDVRAEIAQLRSDARRADVEASELMRVTALDLVRAEVPVRDIAEVLGVSYQRVSQLVNS